MDGRGRATQDARAEKTYGTSCLQDEVHGCTSVALTWSQRATVGKEREHDCMDAGGRATQEAKAEERKLFREHRAHRATNPIRFFSEFSVPSVANIFFVLSVAFCFNE